DQRDRRERSQDAGQLQGQVQQRPTGRHRADEQGLLLPQRLGSGQRADQVDDREQGVGAERHGEDNDDLPAEQSPGQRRERRRNRGFHPRTLVAQPGHQVNARCERAGGRLSADRGSGADHGDERQAPAATTRVRRRGDEGQAPAAVTIASVTKPSTIPSRIAQVTSSLSLLARATASSSMTTYRIEPAARARNAMPSSGVVITCPTRVPMNVGPPAMTPGRMSRPQVGRSPAAVSGATMPNPSVALCAPNPITRSRARLSCPVAAEDPIASPSPKLCIPMPTAMSSDNSAALARAASGPAGSSGLYAVAAPGPSGRSAAARRFIQRSKETRLITPPAGQPSIPSHVVT